jgi:hypothetical protein
VSRNQLTSPEIETAGISFPYPLLGCQAASINTVFVSYLTGEFNKNLKTGIPEMI